MIHIKVDHDVLQNYILYFHDCLLSRSESEVDLENCILLQNLWCTNIQVDLAKYFNYTHKS